MKQIQACIFDLDGVIVDTAKYHYLAWKRLAAELGFEFTIEHNERLKGVSRMRSLDILLEVGGLNFSDEHKNELATRKNEWYVEYISKMDETEVLPGAKQFLTDVHRNGWLTALGSASKNAGLILKNIHMADYFDSIVDGTKTTTAKPDPEVFLLCASELHVQPQTCVVFEDAAAGIEAAIAAGMHSVGIGSPDILGKADLVVPSLAAVSIAQLV